MGTTWYERGAAYWLRRGGLTIVLIGMVALWTFIIGAVIHQVGPAGSPAFISVIVAEVVFSVVTGVREFRRSWRYPRRWTTRDQDRTAAAGTWAGGLGSFARAGSVLAGAVLVVLAFLSYGAILAALVIAFAPEIPSERAARRRLASDLENYRFMHQDRSSHKRKHRH